MATVHDDTFVPVLAPVEGRTIVLAEAGFGCADGVPANLKLCPRCTWNERRLLEAALWLATMVCGLKKAFHRTRHHCQARLAYVAALFNGLLARNRARHPDAPPEERFLPIAQYAL
jgi:hypothetical protein